MLLDLLVTRSGWPQAPRNQDLSLPLVHVTCTFGRLLVEDRYDHQVVLVLPAGRLLNLGGLRPFGSWMGRMRLGFRMASDILLKLGEWEGFGKEEDLTRDLPAS